VFASNQQPAALSLPSILIVSFSVSMLFSSLCSLLFRSERTSVPPAADAVEAVDAGGKVRSGKVYREISLFRVFVSPALLAPLCQSVVDGRRWHVTSVHWFSIISPSRSFSRLSASSSPRLCHGLSVSLAGVMVYLCLWLGCFCRVFSLPSSFGLLQHCLFPPRSLSLA
jgi:hypothetical protein